MKLAEFAEQVKNDTHPDFNPSRVGFDIITILAVISLLVQIGKMIYECRKNSPAILEIAKRRPIMESIWLRRKISRALPEDLKAEFAPKLCESILYNLAKLDESQIQNLINEAANAGITSVHEEGTK